jgi:hypothetical protein
MPRRSILATPIFKAAIAALLIAAALVGSAARPAPAQAATPCWKLLLNDWYDGRIDQTYAVHCYKDALKHLPSDVQTYSSAHDDILRALQSAITKQKHEHKNVSNNTLVPPQQGSGGGTGPSGGGSGNGSGGSGTTGTTTTTSTTTTGTPGRNGAGGLAGTVGSDNASSVPVPLLILGGLALLLVAAGAAGLIAKRVQARRRDA